MNIEQAAKFAIEAHMGQVDKVGIPYFFHPMRVMEAARAAGEDEQVQIACALHDVIEDTDYTAQDLLDMGVQFCTVQAIRAVTKRDLVAGAENDYFEWIRNIIEHGDVTAIKVKMYDARDNNARALNDGFEKMQRKYRDTALMLEKALMDENALMDQALRDNHDFMVNNNGYGY